MPVCKLINTHTDPLYLLNYFQKPEKFKKDKTVYHSEPKGDNLEYLADNEVVGEEYRCVGTIPYRDPAEIADEMMSHIWQHKSWHPRLENSVAHFVTAYDSKDYHVEAIILRAHLQCVMDEVFPGSQWTASLHGNKLFKHWHIAVNMVTFSGDVLNLHEIWTPMRRASDRIAEEYKLTPVITIDERVTKVLQDIKKGVPITDILRRLYAEGVVVRRWKGGLKYFLSESAHGQKAYKLHPSAQLYGLYLVSRYGYGAALEWLKADRIPLRERNLKLAKEDPEFCNCIPELEYDVHGKLVINDDILLAPEKPSPELEGLILEIYRRYCSKGRNQTIIDIAREFQQQGIQLCKVTDVAGADTGELLYVHNERPWRPEDFENFNVLGLGGAVVLLKHGYESGRQRLVLNKPMSLEQAMAMDPSYHLLPIWTSGSGGVNEIRTVTPEPGMR